MPLLLRPNEICCYASKCPHYGSGISTCRGADETRNTQFLCDLVNNGVFVEGGFRSKFDETGRMKIIQE